MPLGPTPKIGANELKDQPYEGQGQILDAVSLAVSTIASLTDDT